MKPIEKQKAFMDSDLVEREKQRGQRGREEFKEINLCCSEKEREEELVMRTREVKKGKPIKNKKKSVLE